MGSATAAPGREEDPGQTEPAAYPRRVLARGVTDGRYRVEGQRLDQFLHDLDTGTVQGSRGDETWELVTSAIAVKAAKAAIRWAMVAGIAACVSTLVAAPP